MYREVGFPSEGQRVAGTLMLPDWGRARRCAAVVLCPDVALVQSVGLPAVARRLAEAGYASVSMDYRWWGRSGGEPRGSILPEAQAEDVQSAVTWLSQQAEVDPERIGLWGAGLGAGVALQVAALDARVRLAIAVCPVGDGARWLSGTRRADAWRRWRACLIQERLNLARTGVPERVAALGDDERALIPASANYLAWMESLAAEVVQRHVPVRSGEALLRFRPERMLDLLEDRVVRIVGSPDDTLFPLAEAIHCARAAGPAGALAVLPRGWMTDHQDVWEGGAADWIWDRSVRWLEDCFGSEERVAREAAAATDPSVSPQAPVGVGAMEEEAVRAAERSADSEAGREAHAEEPPATAPQVEEPAKSGAVASSEAAGGAESAGAEPDAAVIVSAEGATVADLQEMAGPEVAVAGETAVDASEVQAPLGEPAVDGAEGCAIQASPDASGPDEGSSTDAAAEEPRMSVEAVPETSTESAEAATPFMDDGSDLPAAEAESAAATEPAEVPVTVIAESGAPVEANGQAGTPEPEAATAPTAAPAAAEEAAAPAEPARGAGATEPAAAAEPGDIPATAQAPAESDEPASTPESDNAAAPTAALAAAEEAAAPAEQAQGAGATESAAAAEPTAVPVAEGVVPVGDVTEENAPVEPMAAAEAVGAPLAAGAVPAAEAEDEAEAAEPAVAAEAVGSPVAEGVLAPPDAADEAAEIDEAGAAEDSAPEVPLHVGADEPASAAEMAPPTTDAEGVGEGLDNGLMSEQ